MKETVKSIRRIQNISSLSCQVTSSLDSRKDIPRISICCIPIKVLLIFTALEEELGKVPSYSISLMAPLSYALGHFTSGTSFCLPALSSCGCQEFTLGKSCEFRTISTLGYVSNSLEEKPGTFPAVREGNGKTARSLLRGQAEMPLGTRTVLLFGKEIKDFLRYIWGFSPSAL